MQPPEQRDEVEMLSLMLLIRRFEERASQQYQAQKIGGFCHLYIGQEAVVAGAVAAVRPDDYLITAYRDHAHALARGTSASSRILPRSPLWRFAVRPSSPRNTNSPSRSPRCSFPISSSTAITARAFSIRSFSAAISRSSSSVSSDGSYKIALR